jgi:uncharacterized protein (DUF1499 family)
MGGAQADLRGIAMRRRLVIEEPPSRLAHASFWLVLFALAVSLLAVVLARGDLIEAAAAAVAVGSAAAFAALGVLFAFGAFVVIWFNGNPGLRWAVFAFFVGGALAAYPAYLASQLYWLPPLTDVTTDPDDPPRFELIARLRPPGANPSAYPGATAAERQRASYPEIAPLTVSALPEEAYAGALAVVSRRRWAVVTARAYQPGRREGLIEAVARTPLMGFRDDVVVRVRPGSQGAVIDIRSASRYGGHDLGGNAARIRSLSEEIEEELGAQSAAR